ncbi:MAG: DUF4147 domain-containing protein [Phycisphaeraceae bacterium]|nr:DUF4147 domain-containing protein [Phycisphaeraceae bacterium]
MDAASKTLVEELRGFLTVAREASDARAALRPHVRAFGRNASRPLSLLAFGKASLEMMDEAVQILGERVVRGIATVVPERLAALAREREEAIRACGVRLLPADHPLPTKRNVAAAGEVRDFVSSLAPADSLLVLVSGGGSAHLTLPARGLTLDNLRDATRALQRAGRTINELNCVRKHCEQLKGGRLAALSRAGEARVLVLSDVLGDPLDVISSGPFAPDSTTFAEALEVVEKSIGGDAAPEIAAHLRRGTRGEIAETPKQGDPAFAGVTTSVIANNASVVDALLAHAESRGIKVVEIWKSIDGEASAIAARIGAAVRSMPHDKQRRAIIVGGEWTVKVTESSGIGGPSQELALALAMQLRGLPAAALCFSTDGVDGPTDGAGAIVDGRTIDAADAAGLDGAAALAAHDSYGFFERLSGANHLKTGPTGTNLNHVVVVLIDSR